MQSTDMLIDAGNRPNRIDRPTPKVRKALELMVWDGRSLHEAATEVGLTTRAMRLAIEKPAVLAALKREKQVLRESLSARNIHRLREIRDAADNMPAIQAIRTLEGMGDDQLGAASGASASPGITIRILNVVQAGHADARQPVMIDGDPHTPIVSVVD